LNPIRWSFWTWQFAWRWLTSRNVIATLPAIPALAAILGFAIVVSMGSNYSNTNRTWQYQRLLIEAREEHDLTKSRMIASALIQLNRTEPLYVFELARIEADAGNMDAAKAIMSDLAMASRYAPATMWMAEQLGDWNEFSTWEPVRQQQLFYWLKLAAQFEPDNTRPRLLMAELLQRVGDYQGALSTLLPIADLDTTTSLIVARLQQRLGLNTQAEERGQRLLQDLGQQLSEDATNTEARIQASSILAQQNRADESVKLLQEGLIHETTPSGMQQLTQALTEAMVMESRQIAQEDRSPRGLMRSFERLKDAMSVDPNNALLMSAVTRACIEAAESKENELVILREALVQGVSPDTAHFILGTIALQQGDIDQAMKHLEICAETNPNLPGLLNNLAHAICQEENADLERALRLSNAAVANLPNHTYLRETRGQILLRMERYSEAIADLEFALSSVELRPEIRKSLAKAYSALGQAEIAQRQLELLDQGR
jgi:predicted Zn-dependent protease